MGNDYELADYDRSDLIFTKEMLLDDSPGAHAAAARGRVARPMWFEQVMFFVAGDRRARRRRSAWCSLRNPFYSVLALVAHLFALAVLFLLLQAEFLAARRSWSTPAR